MQLEHKIVVVTGASSGLGEATAKAMAKRGAQVALLARNREALARIAAEIEAEGGMATSFPVDLTDAEAVERTTRTIHGELGVPDVLVNNAGSGRWLFADETMPEQVVQAMATPYFSAFYTTRAFLPDMISRGSGHVLNVTSPACYISWPGANSYGVARWAMRGFTELLRADLYKTGVKVSLVCAGEMRTPYFENNPGSKERLPKLANLYRTLEPEEVAEAIVNAVETGKRDVILPLLLRQTLFVQRFAPRLVELLVQQTGFRRAEKPARAQQPARERTAAPRKRAPHKREEV
jgi:short-subunit dehydrogenase